MQNEDDLDRLIRHIEEIVPYVNATINHHNSFACKELIGFHGDEKDMKEWMAIHKGRAGSSEVQLLNLLKFAQELKAKRTT